MLAFIVFTVAALAVFVVDNWWSGTAGFAGLALCGAALSLAAHRWLDGERRRREAERVRVHGLWTGTEFTAGLHWGKFLFSLGGVIGMSVMGGAMLRSSELHVAIIGALTCLFFAPMLPLELLFVTAVLRAGYVLRFDARGIHHCSGTTVPWSDIWSVELEIVEYQLVQTVRFEYLLAVLQPHATPGGYGGVLRRLLGPRPQNRGTRMVFAIGVVAATPDLLLHVARVIGGRAGVPVAAHGAFFRPGVPA
jgi:hypothetical protein